MTYQKAEITIKDENTKILFDTLANGNKSIIARSTRRDHDIRIELQIDDTQQGAQDIINFITSKKLGRVTQMHRDETVHFDIPEDQYVIRARNNEAEFQRLAQEIGMAEKLDELLENHVFAPETKPEQLHEKISLLDQLDAKRWHYIKYLRYNGHAETDADIRAVDDLAEGQVDRAVRKYEEKLVERL